MKIGRAIDLAIELGDMQAAKERLRDLRSEREKVARQLSQMCTDLPTAEELMPRLRAKLREIAATLKSDIALGWLALGGLLGERRLRVHRDGGSKERWPWGLKRRCRPRDALRSRQTRW